MILISPTVKGKNEYTILACFYNRLMTKKRYETWNEIIEDVIKKYSVPRKLCLDIACGTGTISKFLLDKGFKVIGVDNSNDMLKIARDKVPEAEFIKADIRHFKICSENKAVMAVSFYDSLNYLLTDQDMVNMFKSVEKNLSKGAIFLFDMNTREHITASQQAKTRIFKEKDFYAVFKYSGEDRIWILDMDFFVKTKNGKYKLLKERHRERGYGEEDIISLLGQTNLNLLEIRKENKVYDDGRERLSRLYFTVKK